MKNNFIFLLFITLFTSVKAQITTTVMDNIIFHDGYAGIVTTPPPPADVIKHSNNLFAKKLTNLLYLNAIGTKLQINVTISALCDNYDRIGSVNLALVPKGAISYKPDTVKHIEIGRFITPFMNKNVNPTSVQYNFNVDNIAMLFKDESLTSVYDFWIEFDVFGVPYAANKEVAGCAGRNDVFKGKLEFITNSSTTATNNAVLLPLFYKNSFNNYNAKATDSIGFTTKTIKFNVPVNLSDAALFLITSNHGANAGGEEYNRRTHYAYFNNELKLEYIPGRTTCEPFRKYNTQGNGIYGSKARTPEQWQSFSNWCPGDVIDIRRINLGALNAGMHSFTIDASSAEFVEKQGDIPLSLYLQGTKTGKVATINNAINETAFSIYPNPSNEKFTVEIDAENATLIITNLLGKQIINTKTTNKTTELQIKTNGVYLVSVITNNKTTTKKLVVAQ